MERKQSDDLDLDKALDQFDNQELNLTNQEAKVDLDEDPQTAAKIKDQYERFMQQMKNMGATGNDQQGLDNLTSMLGGLLKNLTSQGGFEGGEQSDITKGFEEMFKNLKQDNLQQAAGKLLNQFMDKNLLYEPLLQAKQHYNDYFKKQQGKIPKQNEERYKKQYEILCQIVQTLDNSPQQKQKLIEYFQKMQEYGSPPEGIASTAAFM